MKHSIFIILQIFFSVCYLKTSAQMQINGENKYGNEWIDYSKTYLKIQVAEDGLYKIGPAALTDINQSLSINSDEQWQLWHNGKLSPIYVDHHTPISESNPILFYGEKNRGFLDSFMYKSEGDMLNPNYSLINDSSAYFLTWGTENSSTMTVESFTSEASLPINKTYFIRNIQKNFGNSLINPYNRISSVKIYQSELKVGEGFTSIQADNYHDEFELADIYSAAQEATKLKIILSTYYFLSDSTRLNIIVNDSIYKTVAIERQGRREIELTIDNDYSTIELDILPLDSTYEGYNFGLAHISLNYPSKFIPKQERHEFNIHSDIDSSVVRFEELNTGQEYICWNRTKAEIDFLTPNSTDYFASLKPANTRFILSESSDVKSIERIKKRNFINYIENPDVDFIFLASKKQYDLSSTDNPIDTYKNYRSTNAGGGFETDLVFVEALYDQFAYGVNRHPMAIRNYFQFAKNNLNQLKHALIIGKGRAYETVRSPGQLAHSRNDEFYVPSFGSPASDVLLLSGRGEINPILSFGRLAVNNLSEVDNYLDKIIQYEQIASDSSSSENFKWQKEFVHLSGGKEASETIKFQFKQIEKTIAKTVLDPHITTYYKAGTVSVDSSVSDAIYNQINEGTSVVTFFGHSATTTLGFSIENKNAYGNLPRYPLLIGLGCSAGNHNTSAISVGEYYCLMEDKGFLNLMASASLGSIGSLRRVADTLYSLIGDNGNQLSLGEIYTQSVTKIGTVDRRHASQFQLFGDPAVRLYYPKSADLTVENKSVGILPNIINSALDSFDFNFTISNLGLNTKTPYSYKVIRQYPSGEQVEIIDQEIINKSSRHEVSIKLPVNAKENAGENILFVEVDYKDEIEEKLSLESELNNKYFSEKDEEGFHFYVPANSTISLWPADKSIVPSKSFDFIFSAGDAAVKTAAYLIQIDTTIYFNSPIGAQENVQGEESLIKVPSTFSIEENVVYYWRSRVIGVDTIWSETKSFIHLPDKTGWNASHYFQFKTLESQGLTISDDRHWQYKELGFDVWFKNTTFHAKDYTSQPGLFDISGSRPWTTSQPWLTGDEGIGIIVMQHRFNYVENTNGGLFGSWDPKENVHYFAYENKAESRDSLISFIENKIPNDAFVFFFTVRKKIANSIDASEWQQDSIRNNGKNIFNLMEQYGAKQIRPLAEIEKGHYLFMFKKGHEIIYEGLTDDEDETLLGSFYLPWFDSIARLSIQPEHIEINNQEFLWQLKEDLSSTVELNVDLIDQNGGRIEQTIENKRIGQLSIPSNSKPFKGLTFTQIEHDKKNPILNKVDYLRIYSDEIIGDYAIGLALNQTITSSYKEGQQIDFEFKVHNIEQFNDSIPVEISLIDQANNELVFNNFYTTNISENNSKILTDQISSRGFKGKFILKIQINVDQQFSEINYLNNTLQWEINIEADKVAPLLDVTFDQQHIENYQIVSAQPNIQLTLNDPLSYLALDSLDHFDFTIIQPDQTIYEVDVPSEMGQLHFNANENSQEVILNLLPNFSQAGTYKIIAQGRDQSNNLSASYERYFMIKKQNQFNIKLLPNPSASNVYIDYVVSSIDPKSTIEFNVVNVLGQTIYTIKGQLFDYFSEGQHSFQISEANDWPAGSYFYKINILNTEGNEYSLLIDETAGFNNNGRTGIIQILK